MNALIPSQDALQYFELFHEQKRIFPTFHGVLLQAFSSRFDALIELHIQLSLKIQ